MTLPTTLEGVAELARRMKLERVRDHRPGDPPETYDLRNMVVVVRDGAQRAVVYVGSGADAARLTLFWTAAFMEAEELYLVADTIMRKVQPGEDLSERQGVNLDAWRRGERAHLSEALVVQCFPAQGEASFRMYPYTRQGRHLRWTELDRDTADATTGGALPDHARDGYEAAREFASTVADIRATAKVVGLGPEQEEYHFARAMARFVSEKEGVGAVQLLEPYGAIFMAGAEQ